jgi:hypothetical protein
MTPVPNEGPDLSDLFVERLGLVAVDEPAFAFPVYLGAEFHRQ